MDPLGVGAAARARSPLPVIACGAIAVALFVGCLLVAQPVDLPSVPGLAAA